MSEREYRGLSSNSRNRKKGPIAQYEEYMYGGSSKTNESVLQYTNRSYEELRARDEELFYKEDEGWTFITEEEYQLLANKSETQTGEQIASVSKAKESEIASTENKSEEQSFVEPQQKKAVSQKNNSETTDVQKQEIKASATEEKEQVNIANLSSDEKLGEAIKRAALKLPEALGQQLLAMVNPASLATMAGVLGAYAASHAVGIGFIADAVMVVGAGALIGWQAVTAAKELWGFAQFVNATSEEELDKAGQHLANFVATVGIDIVLGILAKRAASKAKNYGDDLNRVDEVSAHYDDVEYPEGINFDTNQPNHLANIDGFKQQKGVKGAHNLDSFNQAVQQYNLKIVRKDKHPTIEGIYKIEYQVPKKNKLGQYTGDYRTPPNPLIKTVYDPKIISDDKILEWGQQAAVKGYENAIKQGFRIYDETVNNLKFRIFLDLNTGKVTNVHPQ